MEAVYARPPCSCCSSTQEPAILHNLLSKQGAAPSCFAMTSHIPHHMHRPSMPPRLSPVYPIKDRLLPTPRTNRMMREGSTGVPSPYSSTGSPSPPTPEASPGPNVSPVPDTDFSRISYSSTQSKLYQFLTGQRHPSQPSIPHPTSWQHTRHVMPPQNGFLYNPTLPLATAPTSVHREDSKSCTRPTPPTSQRDNQMYANEQVYANERVSPSVPKASAKRSLGTDDQNEPMDLSVKRCKTEDDIDESQSLMNTSILMSILCGQKRSHVETSERADTPCSDDIPVGNSHARVSGSNTRVVLAKKNLFPVRARISDWLVKILQFVKSMPEFEQLPHSDKLTLLLNSWVKLLLIYMAETNFQFAVTPASNEESSPNETTFQEVPTNRSVEIIQGFIKKCQVMNLDDEEFEFLRKSAIFQSGSSGLTVPAYVEHISSLVRQSLQDHIRLVHKNESRRYSQVLMCLPTLCGINSQMVRNLFCKHLEGNNDVELLLKEGLRAL